MIESAIGLAANPNEIEFCIYLDINDLFDSSMFPKANIRIFKGPSLPTSTMTNFMYSQAQGEILMYAADDIVFLSENWDDIVKSELKNPLSTAKLLATNDLSPNSPRIATHGFVSRYMASVLQYLLPPYFESEFCDTWLTTISRKSRTFSYRHDLVIEHRHPNWGKASLDDTYISRKKRYQHIRLFLQFLLLTPLRRTEIHLLQRA
jgi:hypothetical protein